jgi:hypothetical protein
VDLVDVRHTVVDSVFNRFADKSIDNNGAAIRNAGFSHQRADTERGDSIESLHAGKSSVGWPAHALTAPVKSTKVYLQVRPLSDFKRGKPK